MTTENHVTNKDICRKIQATIGENDELLNLIKVVWPHLKFFFCIYKDNSAGQRKKIRRRGRQKKRRENNINEWTGMDFASSIT